MDATLGTARRLRRARRIGATFGRVYLGIRAQRFIARRFDPPDMEQRWARLHRASALAIYRAAVDLRGLILKGCQFLGTRADVLPREYVRVLSRLQDRVPPQPFPVVRRTVERELGCRLRDAFADFSEEPVASASLAQVHEAHLGDGRRVAVKVQYPGIERLVRSDLANLRVLFRSLRLLEPDFDLMPLLEELGRYVPRELNFLNEGRNAETVAGYFADRDDVAIPRVHWELTTRRVLTMQFIDGIKITDLARLRAAGVDVRRVAQTLAEAYCEQILRHGFFHADPHPGNLLVEPRASPRLVLLDFGLARDLPPGFRIGVISFATALLQRDADAMAQAMLELGFETRDDRPEGLVEIARTVLDLARRFRENDGLDPALAAQLGRELPEQIRRGRFARLPSHVVLLARVLGLLSGVNRSLETRVDLVGTILPYAQARSPAPAG